MTTRLVSMTSTTARLIQAMAASVLLALCGTSAIAQAPASEEPGISRSQVLEASLGVAPAARWKWQVQERTGPQATGVLRHPNTGLYYTLEGIHELVCSGTADRFQKGRAVLVPAGTEHIHRMVPLEQGGRKLEVYFAGGDQSRPSPRGVRMLHFSEKPAGVDPGVPYTVRVDEFTLARGARQELTPRNPVIVYVLAGAMTQRIGEKVQRSGAGTVLELPLGTRLVVSNNEPIPMRYLKVELVPTL